MSLSFKRITLSDKSLIEQCFKLNQPGVSEYTFTNLFMWGGPKNIHYAAFDEGLIFKAFSRGENYFMPPIGFSDCRKIFDLLIDYGINNDIRMIKLIPEYQKKYIKKPFLKINPDRNSYDYVYKTESLASLKGWRLDGKRGFIKKFNSNYEYSYERFKETHKKGCLDLIENWAETKKEKDSTVKDELTAFKEFMANYNDLNAAGGVIIIDNKIAAFSFGERLNDTTFVVHYEKADHSYTGAYQAINQLFVQNEVSGKYLFVNREEDMGIEGIRKAKLSYVPVRLVKKYMVTF